MVLALVLRQSRREQLANGTSKSCPLPLGLHQQPTLSCMSSIITSPVRVPPPRKIETAVDRARVSLLFQPWPQHFVSTAAVMSQTAPPSSFGIGVRPSPPSSITPFAAFTSVRTTFMVSQFYSTAHIAIETTLRSLHSRRQTGSFAPLR